MSDKQNELVDGFMQEIASLSQKEQEGVIALVLEKLSDKALGFPEQLQEARSMTKQAGKSQECSVAVQEEDTPVAKRSAAFDYIHRSAKKEVQGIYDAFRNAAKKAVAVKAK